VREWTDYLARETLAVELTADAGLTAETGAEFKVGNQPVLVGLEVVKKG
jgi:hypothetical protein